MGLSLWVSQWMGGGGTWEMPAVLERHDIRLTWSLDADQGGVQDPGKGRRHRPGVSNCSWEGDTPLRALQEGS